MKTLLALLTLTGAALAGDTYPELKLTDGTVLKEVEVRDVSAKGAKLSHKDGVGTYRAAQLPKEFREKYPDLMDAEKQAAVDGERKAAASAEAKKAEAAEHAAVVQKTKDEAMDARIKEFEAKLKSHSLPVGPCRAWVDFIKPGIVDTRIGKRAGHFYSVSIENTSPNRVQAILRGSVFLNGEMGDNPAELKINLAPGETTRVNFPSIFSPFADNTVAVELEGANGRSFNQSLDIPEELCKR